MTSISIFNYIIVAFQFILTFMQLILSLEANLAELNDMDQVEKGHTIKHCKLDKVFVESKVRLTYAIVDHLELKLAVGRALTIAGAERKVGKAPATHMEREVQGWLEALE